MATNDNENLVKTSKIFECKICDYNTSRKFNLELHNETNKHKLKCLATKNNAFLVKTSKTYECDNCDKQFNDRSGLWRHKKKCVGELNNLKNQLANEEKQQQLVEYLLKENAEFKQLMIEQNKHMLEQNKHVVELAKNAGNNHITPTGKKNETIL